MRRAVRFALLLAATILALALSGGSASAGQTGPGVTVAPAGQTGPGVS